MSINDKEIGYVITYVYENKKYKDSFRTCLTEEVHKNFLSSHNFFNSEDSEDVIVTFHLESVKRIKVIKTTFKPTGMYHLRMFYYKGLDYDN